MRAAVALVMIFAVWWLGARRLKGRLPAAGHAPGAMRWWAAIRRIYPLVVTKMAWRSSQ